MGIHKSWRYRMGSNPQTGASLTIFFFRFRIYIPKTTVTTVSTVHNYVSLLALGETKKNTQDNDGQSGICWDNDGQSGICWDNDRQSGICKIMIETQEYAELWSLDECNAASAYDGWINDRMQCAGHHHHQHYHVVNKTWPQILIRWQQKLIRWHQFKPGTKN